VLSSPTGATSDLSDHRGNIPDAAGQAAFAAASRPLVPHAKRLAGRIFHI